MTEDALATEMTALRVALVGGGSEECYKAGRKLWGALNAVLSPHSPRTDRVLGSSCFTHRNSLNTMLPVPGCEAGCVQDGQREVCPECKDEFGDPVPFGDCRVRSVVLGAMNGKDGTGDPATR